MLHFKTTSNTETFIVDERDYAYSVQVLMTGILMLIGGALPLLQPDIVSLGHFIVVLLIIFMALGLIIVFIQSADVMRQSYRRNVINRLTTLLEERLGDKEPGSARSVFRVHFDEVRVNVLEEGWSIAIRDVASLAMMEDQIFVLLDGCLYEARSKKLALDTRINRWYLEKMIEVLATGTERTA